MYVKCRDMEEDLVDQSTCWAATASYFLVSTKTWISARVDLKVSLSVTSATTEQLLASFLNWVPILNEQRPNLYLYMAYLCICR